MDTVVIKAESKDYKLCAILSVQGTTVCLYFSFYDWNLKFTARL